MSAKAASKFIVISLFILVSSLSAVCAATTPNTQGDSNPAVPANVGMESANALIAPADLPRDLVGLAGKLLFVDMSEFRIYAYENGELIRSSVVALGRPGAATLPGSFSVKSRYEIRDMVWKGNTVEDVPYVLYYDGSFAIHGAYWHDNFGERVSSGCVNLPVDEAAWYFNFAEIGTKVVIQY